MYFNVWYEFTICDSVYRVLIVRYVDMWTPAQLKSATNMTCAMIAFDVALVVLTIIYIWYLFERMK